ncbi:hypothetical protein [Hyphomicrobium sp.]|uniref:hypothetical protein n=1 Tax=Hyphomicrobium sp. TaxID=82 RepID=UPI001DE665EC|nr:hypothetical protein [Hyphomicrobium sp.]MBY0560144.1 hypothetical protein [Hyphomicrobium sp.]
MKFYLLLSVFWIGAKGFEPTQTKYEVKDQAECMSMSESLLSIDLSEIDASAIAVTCMKDDSARKERAEK